jgi:hypothetical protein
MESLDFLEPLNFHIKPLNFLHKLHLIGPSMDIDPFEVLRQLNTLVERQIYRLIQKIFVFIICAAIFLMLDRLQAILLTLGCIVVFSEESFELEIISLI